MRIGIDATPLPPQPMGAGYYIINLIRHVVSINKEFDLVVFAQKHSLELLNLTKSSFLEIIRVGDAGPAARLAWEQVRLPGMVHDHKIELLHSLHYTRPVWLPCKSIVTFHDMTFFLDPRSHTLVKRLFFPLAMQYSARTSDALIAVSENTANDMRRILGIDGNNIFVTPLGVSDRFSPIHNTEDLARISEKYNLPDKFILYLGLIEPRKNLTSLLEAFQKVLQDESSYNLVIAGAKGWHFRKVFEMAAHHDFEGKVHFPGYIADEDLAGIYNLADLFIYPSTYEGFGLPPLEAMACGTPVITTSTPSIAANMGEAAILVPPGDPIALWKAMKRILNNPHLDKAYTMRGIEQASRFSWLNTASCTLDVYRTLA
jgi:glycosyltransferase involved in cell wall biosynthesis